MDEQFILVETDELDTRFPASVPPAARSNAQYGQEEHLDDQQRKALEARIEAAEKSRLPYMFPRDWPRLRAYGAALVGGFALVPILALALSAIIYLVASQAPNWVPLAWGMGIASAVWLLFAIPMSLLTARDRVNANSYGQLINRLSQLETRLQVIQVSNTKLEPYQLIALEEAFATFQELDAMVYESTTRLPWVLGLGYAVAWAKLHRAEEALLEVEPVEMVVRQAYHDYLAISNSSISNAKEIQDRLHEAVEALDRDMASAVPLSTPLANVVEELREVEGQILKIAKNLHIEEGDKDDEKGKKAHKQRGDTPNAEANARISIRVIRRTLNEYRDLLWENIIRARNRLMGGIFIAGCATFMLLSIAFLAVPQGSSNSDAVRPAILAAIVYYMVGAIAGLFGTIYVESTSKAPATADTDDYGLTLARLIGTPLLSGLAGVGGALVYSTLTQITNNHAVTLSNIFTLNQLDYLIAAALFGYTPNLLVQGLQQRTNKYMSNLKSTKASTSGDSSDN